MRPIFFCRSLMCFALLTVCVSTTWGSTLADGLLEMPQDPSSTAVTSTPVATFFDGTFNSSSWVSGPVIFAYNSGSVVQTNKQALSGGDPGAYWQTTATSHAGSTVRYETSYFNPAAVYVPSTQGPITDMSGGFTQDLLSYTGVSDVFGTSILIMQNGSVYRPLNWYGLQDTAPGWYGSTTLFSDGNQFPIGLASDWSLASGSGLPHPDFSADGSAITFGLMTDIYFNGGSGTLVGGIDNWTFNVYASPVPEPGTAGLVVAIPLLLLRRKRATFGMTKRPGIFCNCGRMNGVNASFESQVAVRGWPIRKECER